MRKFLFPLCCLIAWSCKNSTGLNVALEAPKTKKIPKEFTENGNKREDDYFWLSNSNDSAVINHLKEENGYEDSVMKHTEGLQKKIYDELVARIDQKYESLPTKQNGYWIYERFEEGRQYPYYCRKKENTTAPEELILDIPEMSKGHQIFQVRGRSISRDNNWIAYGIDTTGGRRSTVYFKNLNNQKTATETIPNTAGSYAWGNDNQTFYYTVFDHTVRSYKALCHKLGSDPRNDEELYTETDSTYGLYLYPSKDNKYIFLISSSTTTTEVRYIDASLPSANPVLIQKRQQDLIYSPYYAEGDIFYIYNNKDAKNFKLSKVPINRPTVENWTDVIPHSDSAFLEGFEVLKDYIVAQQKINGLSQIKVINRHDNSSYYVDFGEEDYVANMSTATDAYDLDSIRYYYTSLTTPGTDFKYKLGDKQKTLLKQQKVRGGFDASLYETKRLWAKAADSTMVPISLVYRKDNFRKDGSNPLLLYAYGSYGANSDPYFSSSVISLLDRGFAYAVAHIRGGQELGRKWYEDGKLLKKKNTFTDFVDCAQFLVNEKYSSPNKLFANGASAGGMLMGAVINLRPDLFKGVLAEVPWMDVITDMLNPDLPLTTLEYDEWGDPHQKKYYGYMITWSPYDNVKKGNYPAIFSTGGLNDTQVPYYSPAKWVAKIRENNTGNNIVLFKCNMGAGHSGESGRFERQKLTALKYAFMLDLLGIGS